MRRSFRDPSGFRSLAAALGGRLRARVPPRGRERATQATVNALRARFRTEYETWRKPWRLPDGNVDPQYAEMTRQVVRDFLFEEEHFTTSARGTGFLQGDPPLSRVMERRPGRSRRRTRGTPWSRRSTPRSSSSRVGTGRRALATRAALKERGLVLEAAERKNAFDALSKQLQESVSVP